MKLLGRRARCTCCGEVTQWGKRIVRGIEQREWRHEVTDEHREGYVKVKVYEGDQLVRQVWIPGHPLNLDGSGLVSAVGNGSTVHGTTQPPTAPDL